MMIAKRPHFDDVEDTVQYSDLCCKNCWETMCPLCSKEKINSSCLIHGKLKKGENAFRIGIADTNKGEREAKIYVCKHCWRNTKEKDLSLK